jgi:hypothetical protein
MASRQLLQWIRRVPRLCKSSFSPGSLQTFLDIELAEHMRAPAVRAARLETPDFSIGEFYADIIAEMRRLCGEFGVTRSWLSAGRISENQSFLSKLY